MSRKTLLLGTMMAVTVVLLAVSLSRTARADRPYDARSLRGEYFFNMIEIRNETSGGIPVVDYCDQAGTVTFDGAGGGSVDLVRRCSFSGSGSSVFPFTYTVSPDGSLLLRAEGDDDDLHGQILDGGRLLLMDSTTSTSTSLLVQHVVAAKR